MASADREKEVQSLVEERKLLLLEGRKLDDVLKQLEDKSMQVSRERNKISTRMLEIEDAISTKVKKINWLQVYSQFYNL